MDVLNIHDLEDLLNSSDTPCVSIYLPTHRAGSEIQQDSIRLKNLLNEAEERLTAVGLRGREAKELLEPAQALVLSDLFWKRQSDGLAVFLSAGLFRYYRLPVDFDTLMVVADRFHVKPLLPVLSDGGRFYILALSQSEIRLLQGTRYSVSQVELEDVPHSLIEALRWNDPEKRFQFHTTTRTPGGERVAPAIKSARPAIFHGHGVASADDPKDYILRYFHRIDEGLSEVLEGAQAPLVVAGVEYLHPIYWQANTYPLLVEEGIAGNPEELSAQELHQRAWRILEPSFKESQQEWTARYMQLAGSGSELAANRIEQVVSASYYARVETLFVALDVQRWGTFDPDTNEVQVRDDPLPGDEDLLDFAAVHTLLNGGTVYTVNLEKMPDGVPLAAVLRY